MSKGRDLQMNTSFEKEYFSGSSSDEEDPFTTHSLQLHGDEDISIEWVNECEDLKNIAKPIRLDMIMDAIKNRDIEMEFRILIRITETNFHTKKIIDYCPQSMKLNRYASVLPYSFNRVVFEKDPTIDFETNQYINASMIKGYFEPDKQRVKYIATQAPMCNTLETFWQMIWKLNIRDIFCLTKAQENGKEMAHIYWKSTDDFLLDEFKIKVQSKVEEGIAIKRDIDFINTFTKENREILHYHIESWDDDKVPTSPGDIDALLNVAEQCAKELETNKEAKVLVHCSAGIGRTGVFICLVEIYSFLSSLAGKSKNMNLSIQEVCNEDPTAVISIFDLVRSLREQRWGSVKTFVTFYYSGTI